jgi:hypothetical protein
MVAEPRVPPLIAFLLCGFECKVRAKGGDYRGNALSGYRKVNMAQINQSPSKRMAICA